MEANQMHGKKARWELLRNAILNKSGKLYPKKPAAVGTLASYLKT